MKPETTIASLPDYAPEGVSADIIRKRYALHEHEAWSDICERVGGHVASAESGENVPKYKEEFTSFLLKNLFVPGGRIMYGSGRPKGQLMNCFVIPTGDSREAWGKSVSDMIVICGTGGGLGVNGSPIRPRGTPIAGSGGVATGSVSLFEIINSAGEVIKAGGGRRTALMMCLGLTHGDIEEFLDKKLDLNQLNNANVSVWFDENPEEFFALVKGDKELQLKFRGKTVGKVPAKKIWEKIIANALKSGEPGLLNGYLFNKMSNIAYHAPIISTNPCGEIGLIANDVCCLGAVNLPRFVFNGEVNYGLLSKVVRLGVRFLDNVISVNNYPLPEIQATANDIRRIGLGVMGLHDMLLMMGLKYNSPRGLELVDHVMNFIKVQAYEASIELAKEKGAFPRFQAEPFLKGGFAKTLKPTIRAAIREHGIRNCALLTVAPTGTTSMASGSALVLEEREWQLSGGVTSGIEPMFAPAYRRKYRDGDALKEEIIIHPLLKAFIDQKKSVKHFQGAFDLSLRDHFEMQRTVQKHLDNACSKTINLPQGTSAEELSDLYMEFFPELKGVTVYPDGSRENQPLTPISLDEAIKLAKEAKSSEAEEGRCRSGVCEI